MKISKSPTNFSKVSNNFHLFATFPFDPIKVYLKRPLKRFELTLSIFGLRDEKQIKSKTQMIKYAVSI